jgi:hypothetical protein
MANIGKLPKRPLGKTGLTVSVLGFGASPLGGVFQVRSRLLAGFHLCGICFGSLCVTGLGVWTILGLKTKPIRTLLHSLAMATC